MNPVAATAGDALDAAAVEDALEAILGHVLSSRRSAAAQARQLAALTRPDQTVALRWVGVIARTNAELAFQYADRIAHAFTLLDHRAIEAWTHHCMDVFDRRGLYPAIEAVNAIATCTPRPHPQIFGLPLDDVIDVLTHFIGGLAGRRLTLAAAPTASAFTDTETVFLPALLGGLADRRAHFQAFKCSAALLWAQTRFGTWRDPIIQALQALDDASRQRFIALENLRLEAVLRRELPGIARAMNDLTVASHAPLPPAWQAAVAAVARPAADASHCLAWLPSLTGLPTPACYHGGIDLERVINTRAARLADQRDRFRVHVAQWLDAHNAPSQPAADSRPPAPRLTRHVLPDDTQPDGARVELQLDGQPFAPPSDANALMQSIIQDLGALPDDYLTPAGPGAYTPQDSGARNPDDVWQGTYHEDGAWRFNEWDDHRQAYKKNWCVLRELTIPPADMAFYQRCMRRHHNLIKRLRRTFEALRGEPALLRKQPQGDDIDLDALVDAQADLAAGREMPAGLFLKQRKAARNIAVAFMVDMSGSTQGWINDAEREALLLLAEALETLGDRYAIYGFSGWTRKRCEVYVLKRFDDAYDDTVKARICGIEPKDYTRMGAPIRHLTRILSDIDAKIKLLITLSDGKPDDYDLEYRGAYGIADTRRALIEAKTAGIHPYCITIDSAGPDYLPHMYGAVNYSVIDDVQRLPTQVADIYRTLTT